MRGEEILIPEKPVKVAASTPASGGKSVKASKKKPSDGQPAVASASTAKPKSYRVKTGDTLYRIALRHGVSVAEILAINGLGGAPAIKPGDKIKIPAGK